MKGCFKLLILFSLILFSKPLMASYHDGALGVMLSLPYVPLGIILVIIAFATKNKLGFLWIIIAWVIISIFFGYFVIGAEDSVSNNIIFIEFVVISFFICIPLVAKIIKDK